MAENSDQHTASGMRHILLDHASRYPLWNIADLYKLLHQAALGSEHAAPEESRGRAWLLDEIAGLAGGPEEPLVDTISPDNALVRVHLRPFVRANHEVEPLLAAFLRTARDFHGSPVRLEDYGRTAIQLAGEELLPFDAAELASFFAQMKARGFPAAHHSPAYVTEYSPAYRVVARRFLPLKMLRPENFGT